MSNTQLATKSADLPAIAQERSIPPETWNALKNTIFSGASDESTALAWDYCKARKLDPLKKPVHVVKVWDSDARKMVESLWPSIGELRTTAMRTKQYAGREPTVFGDDLTEDIGGVKITFPQWAQVTVYRVVNGERVPFPGPRVYWKEAYAQIKSGAPNMMWKKRTYGQLDKCAEAAALRAAFPEEIGDESTAEEMHGRTINDNFSGPEADENEKASRPTPPKKNKGVAAAKAKTEEREMKAAEKVEDTEIVDDDKSEDLAAAPAEKEEEPPKEEAKKPEPKKSPPKEEKPEPKEKEKEPEAPAEKKKEAAKKAPPTEIESGQKVKGVFAIEGSKSMKDGGGKPLLELQVRGDEFAGTAYSRDTENPLLLEEGMAELTIAGATSKSSGKKLAVIQAVAEAVEF